MRDTRPPGAGGVFAGDAALCADATVVVVSPPGGSSGVADGVTGPCSPGSPE